MAKSSNTRRPVKAQKKPRSKDLSYSHVQPNPGFAEAFFQANAEILKQAARNAQNASKATVDPSPKPPAEETPKTPSITSTHPPTEIV